MYNIIIGDGCSIGCNTGICTMCAWLLPYTQTEQKCTLTHLW